MCVSSTYDLRHPYKQEMSNKEIEAVCAEAKMHNVKSSFTHFQEDHQ